ncbi:MAG: hypothetical protein HOD60_03065 [Candidatus Nitrosopelagicus sp.]|nr:hypothetical protein [Candidatus Nitrosopelagicus sp.]
METIIRAIERSESQTAKKNKPVVIKWKGQKLLRQQSVNSAINDIYESSRSMEFIKINLIGASSSGKTVLSSVLAQSLHERDPSFEVHFFQDEDLIDFRTTIESLSNSNQILVFDDLSGLVSKFGKTALDKLKAEITTIRHINPNADRKIIMILNFHAQKTLDKFIRISNFTFYTDCQNEEIGYLEELLGKQQKQKIMQFAKLRAQSRMYHKFTFPLSGKNYFTYKDGDPFRVLLYNNGISTRFIVSPQLSWILEGNTCPICNPPEKTKETNENLKSFVDDYSKKFTKGIAKRAVELTLLRQGINTQPKRVAQAEKYISQYIKEKKINLEELAKQYNLKPIHTHINPDKQPYFEVKP